MNKNIYLVHTPYYIRSGKMEFIAAYTKEEKEVLEIALYSYLNYYRARLENVTENNQRLVIKDKIRIAEDMLDRLDGKYK